MLRSDTTDMDGMLSASWPAAASSHRRQVVQPPQAPLPKPCQTPSEVPPLILGPTLDCCSDTTAGEDDDTRWSGLSFSHAGSAFDEDLEEPLLFSFEGFAEDYDTDDSPCDFHMLGFESLEQEEVINNCRSSRPKARAGSKPGPALLSVISQVASSSVLHSCQPVPSSESRSQPEPPLAPVLRPQPSPMEVSPFELPSAAVELSSTSPRQAMESMARYASEPECEEEQLIFALDSSASNDVEEDDEEAEEKYLDLTGFTLEKSAFEADDVIEKSLEDAVFAVDEALPQKIDIESSSGASDMLLSVLEQVAAEARASAKVIYPLAA